MLGAYGEKNENPEEIREAHPLYIYTHMRLFLTTLFALKSAA